MPGEVEYFSILDNKSATKNYWENKMLATMEDPGGWESVANVHFQPIPGEAHQQHQQLQVEQETAAEEEVTPATLTPPPEFIPAPPPQFDTAPAEVKESAQQETRPAKQYVYGVDDAPAKAPLAARIVETVAKKPSSQENVIEAEIRAQQLKEVALRQEGVLRAGRDKGASSPASHDSDEGFVDRLGGEDTPTPGYTHSLPGHDGEPVIYDSVSPPPPQFFSDRTTPTLAANTTETKIAMEIRELKEREDELRQMRERLIASRENLLDDEEVRSSASREQLLEDHLTSLTTTTDEGNFSECGDPASSEDKSSDGSNSRIMSPDLHPPAAHLDYSRRKVTVKPYEDDDEDQPVYTRMQKESVIEREIRLAREREEAYRREKGLNAAPVPRPAQSATHASTIRPTPISTQQDGRDVQHRLATSRIQMEIQETSIKERELRAAGKILTTSEESVDSKVTRMSDFTDNIQLESPRSRPVVASPSASSSSSSSSSSAASCSSSHPSTFTTPSSTPKRSLSPRSPSSPVPNFTPSPAAARLSRSLSTNNLSNSSISAAPANSRAPKGLMQKFIASRGKMTGSAFASHPPSHAMTTSRGVVTRPMRVEPKAAVVQRETLAKNPHLAETTTTTTAPALHHDPAALAHSKQVYRRSYCTAEEKIQSELKEMQMREEELRRLRARQLAQSQPNLLDVHGGVEHDEQDEEEGQHSLQEVAGLRTAQSIPNLLDDADHTQAADKGVRRRSALIAQWENRIQQTTDT